MSPSSLPSTTFHHSDAIGRAVRDHRGAGRPVNQIRGMPLFRRDRTLIPGLLTGLLVALEFLLIYRGLVWTTVTRGTLFLYLAPFFVVVGSPLARCLAIIFTLRNGSEGWPCPLSALSSRSACRRRRSFLHQLLGDLMLVGGAPAWAATAHHQVDPAQSRQRRKTLLYQLVVSAPLLGTGAMVFRRAIMACPRPSRLARLPIKLFGW